MNEPITATEVVYRNKLFHEQSKVYSRKLNKSLAKLLTPLVKRSLILASNYGSITSLVCINIEVSSHE